MWSWSMSEYRLFLSVKQNIFIDETNVFGYVERVGKQFGKIIYKQTRNANTGIEMILSS